MLENKHTSITFDITDPHELNSDAFQSIMDNIVLLVKSDKAPPDRIKFGTRFHNSN